MYPKRKVDFLNKSIRTVRLVSIMAIKTKNKAQQYIPKALLNISNRSN